MARKRVKTLRGRITLLVTLVTALALVPVGVGGVALVRSITSAITWQDTTKASAAVAARHRTSGATITLNDLSASLVQVVSHEGQVVAASHDAWSLPPLSTLRPSAAEPVVNTSTCLPKCVHLTAMRVSAEPRSHYVYVGTPTPLLLSTKRLEIAAVLQIALVVALIGWITWVVTGRALRPIATMGDELGAVHATDLSRRVTEPQGAAEVSSLARAVNETLTRLERSSEQQRQFASDASHELRTPLAGLRTHLESAQLYPEDTDVAELADSALRDADRVEAIIADLLLLARIGSRVDLAKEPVDLSALVRTRTTAMTRAATSPAFPSLPDAESSVTSTRPDTLGQGSPAAEEGDGTKTQMAITDREAANAEVGTRGDETPTTKEVAVTAVNRVPAADEDDSGTPLANKSADDQTPTARKAADVESRETCAAKEAAATAVNRVPAADEDDSGTPLAKKSADERTPTAREAVDVEGRETCAAEEAVVTAGDRVAAPKVTVDVGGGETPARREAANAEDGETPVLKVEVDVEDGVTVLGVRAQLDRLVGNLLDNAGRHALGLVTVSLRARDGRAVLAVDNDGPPIPEQERERIFERFARLDTARGRGDGGTGLGLAIARDVAIAHRGSLHVEGGARFVLEIPLHNVNT